MTVRVYLPVTSSGLARLVAEGRLDGPLPGHAVTTELRQSWPEGDQELWEYAALMAAAASSRSAAGPTDRRRRCVVAADVPAAAGAGDDPTGVLVPAGVTWSQVAAALVDLEDDADDDADLAWFATQEIAALV